MAVIVCKNQTVGLPTGILGLLLIDRPFVKSSVDAVLQHASVLSGLFVNNF